MRAMGFPAIQQRFDVLAAETQARSSEVVRAAEVVSITMGKLIQSSNGLAANLYEVRSLLLAATPEIRQLFERLQLDECAPDKIADCAAILATMKRFRRFVARPYFANVEGRSAITAANRLVAMKTDTAGDGRTARRLAKRVREAAEDSEVQRLRFVAALDDALQVMEVCIAKHFDVEAFRQAYVQALAKRSIERFPVVNAYLAK